MCGISGIVRFDRAPLGEGVLGALNDSLHHRGPDDAGFLGWSGNGVVGRSMLAGESSGGWVGLAHRRLSILDLSAAGWQPMSTEDERFHLTFNGEIYNFLELRSELRSLGHRFRSECDTEVLLRGYAEWGRGVLPRLVGMFAFVVIDLRDRRLFMARDPFGIKPLFYSKGAWGLAFASEIKALLELAEVPRRANPERVHEFLRTGMTDHGFQTMYAGVHQVPGGHCLEMGLDETAVPSPRRYWVHSQEPRTDLTFEQAADELRDRFLHSVRLHLRSDVAVGAALSGGIDSSAIVGAMRHVQPEVELHTFSFVADDERLSEERWVDAAAAAAGAVSHKVRASVDDLLEDIDDLIRSQDEPFGSTSIYAQYRVFRAARDAGIKVMLDGQGADELLGGYSSYLVPRLARLFGRGKLLGAGRFLQAIRRLPRVRARAVLLSAGVIASPPGMERLARRLGRRDVPPLWLNAAWFESHGVGVDVPPSRRGRADLKHWLASSIEVGLPALLRFEDRNSMAHSIESRVPFLTPELWSFVHSLPDEYLISSDATSKSVFRRAMRGIVPDTILDRRDKIGFETPEREWLGTLRHWVDAVLRGSAASAIPALHQAQMLRNWQAVLDGRSAFDFRIWRWINLIRWAELQNVEFDGP